jgi:hypothetical protein
VKENQAMLIAQPIYANKKPVAESPVPENEEPRQHILVFAELSTISFFAVTACMVLPMRPRRNMRAAMAISATGTPMIVVIAAEKLMLFAAVPIAAHVTVWHCPTLVQML